MYNVHMNLNCHMLQGMPSSITTVVFAVQFKVISRTIQSQSGLLLIDGCSKCVTTVPCFIFF